MNRDTKKLIQFYNRYHNIILLMIGFLFVSMIVFPYAILGQGSYVEPHDQMDGEIINYIYRAKYLFKSGPINEFMNGMGKASMIPPAPAGVLFYKMFSPFTAFALMHWFCLLISVIGMYFLCRKLSVKEEIALMVACIFSFLPFYPVYGLAAYGQPLLLWAMISLAQGEKKKIALLSIVVCAAFSSLSLVGFAFVALGLAAILFFLIRKDSKKVKGLLLGELCLIAVYIFTNMELFSSLLGNSYVTHRSEMLTAPTNSAVKLFWNLLIEGGAYSKVYSPLIFVFICVSVLGTLFFNRNEHNNTKMIDNLRIMGVFAGILFGCICLSVLWNVSFVFNMRKAIGGMLLYFQADRIYWTFPFFWMVLLALALNGLYFLLKMGKTKKWTKMFSTAVIGGVVLLEFLLIFRDNTINKNIRLVFLPSYKNITWESIYMEPVMDQIAEVVDSNKESYRVVSLGIHPAVALYNGFYCLDGYSNNYDIEYKHTFRKMIAEELEQNEEMKNYFDAWGNRAYLGSQPYGINGMVSKKSEFSYTNPQFNLEAMKDMGVRYLFAAKEIKTDNLQKNGLKLKMVSGSPFSSADSYYEVWLYELIEE